MMNTIEFEAQKACLAREIGFLEGKAKVIFHDDWSMTAEELGMI